MKLFSSKGFMPTPSKGTIGSLNYPTEERKKLAKKSLTYACPDCGVISEFLKSQNSEDSITSTAEEAKEIIKTMSMKVLQWATPPSLGYGHLDGGIGDCIPIFRSQLLSVKKF